MQSAKSILYSPNPVNVRAASRVVSSSSHLAVLQQVAESAMPPIVRSPISPSSPHGFFHRSDENLKLSSGIVLETLLDQAAACGDVQASPSSRSLSSPDDTIPSAPLLSLLRDERSQIHVFGPSNRSGLDELLTLLRTEHQLSVTFEILRMERYRLRPMPNGDISCASGRFADIDMEWPYATSSVSCFLHIVCSLATIDQHSNGKLSDID